MRRLDSLFNSASMLKFLTDQNVVLTTRGVGSKYGALQRYLGLPAMIVTILSTVASRVAGVYPKTHAELMRNIGQETGSATRGVPHFKLLMDGLRQVFVHQRVDLNPEFDPEFTTWLMSSVSYKDVHYALGVVMALEFTATPELKVVGQIINQIIGREVVTFEKTDKLDLNGFFQLHVDDFEPSHQNGLHAALIEEVHETAIFPERPLKSYLVHQGFMDTINQMEGWWERICSPMR